MAWPTDDLVTSNVDSSADSAAAARANIYTLFLRVKELIAGRNTANGVAPLDASSKVPVANIPALSYLPSTGGTVSGATTFSAGLTSNGAIGITSGGLGLVGGITASTGNIVVSSGAISASGNIASTSTGNITTASGYILATKASQTSYSTAGLQSWSTSGNAGLGLHCVGASAAYIEHARGGNGIAVKDYVGSAADLACQNLTASGGTVTVATNVYFQSQAGDTYYTFDSSDYFRYNKTSDTLTFYRNNVGKITMSDAGIYGTSDNAVACGVPTNRWTVVYAVNGTIQTSDKRRKDDLGPLGDCGSIIDALRPVAFRWKASGEKVVGFYAQDVEPLIPEAVVVGDDAIDWGMKPDRLIPFLVREIQTLRARVAILENK